MKYFIPFENETIIAESDDKQILLTNKRIRQLIDGERLISIMLNKVSAISSYRFHMPMLLVAAIILLVIGTMSIVTERDQEMGVMSLVIGVGLLLFYWFTRKHVVTVTSDSGSKLMFRTRGMKQEAIFKFINQIEEAKSKYTNP